MNWSRIFVVISSMLGLGACTMDPPTVSLNAAISGVQKDMIMTKALPITSYATWTEIQKVVFAAEVRQTQCAQDLADPIVPIITGPTTLNLIGSFSKSGAFQVGGVANVMPTVSFTGSASKTVQQSLTVPVSFVSLTSIPSVEMSIMLNRIATSTTQQHQYAQTDEYVTGVLDEQKAFAAFIATITSSYKRNLCAGTVFRLTNFVGAKAPPVNK